METCEFRAVLLLFHRITVRDGWFYAQRFRKNPGTAAVPGAFGEAVDANGCLPRALEVKERADVPALRLYDAQANSRIVGV
jgi:hypothetical protein